MFFKRLDTITNLLEKNGSVEVAELSDLLGVTQKTIRQDLGKLEELNIATRVHGGAVLKGVETDIYPVNSRKLRNIEEKKRIAVAALNMINDGDVIILDSGTTNLELAKILNKSVIVLTNDPYIEYNLLDNEAITLHSTGGRLQRERGSLTYGGDSAIETIKSIRAQKCFIATSAINFESGLMVFSTLESSVKQAFIAASDEIICLADYTKFHKTAFSSFTPLDTLDQIIVDKAISTEDIKELEKRNIKVTVV